MLKRLGYDVYTSGLAPVIELHPYQVELDYRLLADLIELLVIANIKVDHLGGGHC
jgi:hypothetical protein